MQRSYSFFETSWRRLKRNKGAVFGLVVIFISILSGLFAYYIVEDPTPNADRQIVEIQAKKPGYKQLFIKVKKQKNISPTGFFNRLMYGEEDKYDYIPINSYQVTKDSVITEKYIDEGVGERLAISKSA